MSGPLRVLVANDTDGRQILVEIWEDSIDISTRPERGAIWGTPLPIETDDRRTAAS